MFLFSIEERPKDTRNIDLLVTEENYLVKKRFHFRTQRIAHQFVFERSGNTNKVLLVNLFNAIHTESMKVFMCICSQLKNSGQEKIPPKAKNEYTSIFFGKKYVETRIKLSLQT